MDRSSTGMTATTALPFALHDAGVRHVALAGAHPPEPLAGTGMLEPIACPDARLATSVAQGFTRARAGNAIVPVLAATPTALTQSLSAASGGEAVLVIALPAAVRGADAASAPPDVHRERVTGPADLGPGLQRAVAGLRTGVPGPVVLELAEDARVPSAPRPLPTSGAGAAPAAEPPWPELRRVMREMLAARRPVLLAGTGAALAPAGTALAALAQWAAIPVATTPQGRGAFPEAHPLALGSLGACASPALAMALGEADLLVAVGLQAREAHLLARARCPVLLVGPREPFAARAQEVLAGDPAPVLEALVRCGRELAGFAPRPTRGVPERIAAARSRWLSAWRAAQRSEACPPSPHHVLAQCQRTIPPHTAVLVPEAGPVEEWLAPFYPAAPGAYVPGGVPDVPGAGVGLALGASLAQPERVCIHLASGASENTLAPGLEAAHRQGVGILSVLVGARADGGAPPVPDTHVETVESPDRIAAAFARGRDAAQAGHCAVLRFVTAPLR